MILVDSSGWIEFLTAGPLGPEYRALLLKPESVVTPSIVVYEVFKTLARVQPRLAEEAVGEMRLTRIVSLTEALAIGSARVSLERRLPMADAIVYTTALAEGAELVTSDAHFKGLPGVRYLPKPA